MTEPRKLTAVFRDGAIISEPITIDPPANAGDPFSISFVSEGKERRLLMCCPADEVKAVKVMIPKWMRP